MCTPSAGTIPRSSASDWRNTRTQPIRPAQNAWRSHRSGRAPPGPDRRPKRRRSIRWYRRPGPGYRTGSSARRRAGACYSRAAGAGTGTGAAGQRGRAAASGLGGKPQQGLHHGKGDQLRVTELAVCTHSGGAKIACVPMRLQIMCAWPAICSGPYLKVARPSLSHVISNTPGCAVTPFTRSPGRNGRSAAVRSGTKASTITLRNVACCCAVRLFQSRLKRGRVSNVGITSRGERTCLRPSCGWCHVPPQSPGPLPVPRPATQG